MSVTSRALWGDTVAQELALIEEELSAQTKAVDNTLTHILHYENEALRADGNIRAYAFRVH